MKIKIAFLRNHWAVFNGKLFGTIKHDAGLVNTLKIFFPGTSGPIVIKLGMKHWRLRPITFCSNDNFVKTMTYFTAMSKLATESLYRKMRQ